MSGPRRSTGAVPSHEQFLAAIVTSASEAIIGKTVDGRITSWNAAAERLYGYTADEALGRHISLIVPPERRDELDAILTQIAAGERVPELETVRVRKDGAKVAVAVTISPICDTAGAVIGASSLARDIGERKRAEAGLAASESRVRAMLDTSLDAVILIDPHGRVVEFSRAAEAMFGRTREEAVDADIADLIVPPAMRGRHREGLRRFRETGDAPILGKVLEFEALRADGSEFPVELRIELVETDGETQFVGFVSDVGERRQAESELRASEKRMRAMLDASLDAVIMVDPHGRVVEFSHAAEEMFGYSRKEAVGMELSSLIIPPSLREDHAEDLRRYRDTGEAPFLGELYEVDLLRADGQEFPAQARVELVETEGQTQFVGFFSDLSRLRRSEESYRILFDRHPAPMWVFDPETLRFLAVNEAAVEAYGYSREEFLAMTIADIRPPEDVPRMLETVGRSGRRIDLGGWRHRRRDGSLIDVLIATDSIDFEGRPARIVLAWDVTESRRLEEQLRQAQKMEAIGSLAGGIAHDFNNLLMVVQLAAAELARLSGAAAGHDALALIQNTVRRATALTRQLLAFSRQQLLHPERTDLSEVVREEITLLERVIGEDIVLAADLAPGLPSILADHGQLTQVVLNLAVNAREAMPRGGTITLATREVVVDARYADEHLEIEPGQYVLLTVTDDGEGMDEETRARAFEPFFTTKESGTGFGLATVYGIVRQSGGHVWLYSEPGVGTTFKLYFPVLDDEAAIETPPSRADAERASRRGSETILLVEDEPALRPLVAGMLEAEGYTVMQAGDAEEALELARESGDGIDLLITDVVMPGLNGRELAERLTADHPRLRVLFSSGYPADTILRHGIEQSTVSFIEKPYGPDELLREVRRILDVPVG